MLLVFPHIKLRHGECAFCIEGEIGTKDIYEEYSHNPLKLLDLWRRENSKTIHITDLDSLEKDSNIENANSILFLATSIDIPVQLYSNFQNIEECKLYLESGIYRIVIGELLLKDIESVKELMTMYPPSRIAFGGAISGNKYISTKNVTLAEYCQKVHEVGGSRVVLHDKSWVYLQPDLDMFTKIYENSRVRFTLIDPCQSYEELSQLNRKYSSGIDSIILGNPLYTNKFPCQKIWRIAEAKMERNRK